MSWSFFFKFFYKLIVVEQLAGNNKKLQWNPVYIHQGNVCIIRVSILSGLQDKAEMSQSWDFV